MNSDRTSGRNQISDLNTWILKALTKYLDGVQSIFYLTDPVSISATDPSLLPPNLCLTFAAAAKSAITHIIIFLLLRAFETDTQNVVGWDPNGEGQGCQAAYYADQGQSRLAMC